MNQKDIIAFFNQSASTWDAEMIRDDEIINTILDNANIHSGKDILDVACGTGVLIPDYLARNVKSITAIDIAPEMIKIARGKFTQANLEFICGNVETTEFQKKFDCIVVYNAFPHFPEPKRLIKRLISLLKEGGTLTVAHGMSRAQIDAHHSGSASKVSLGLIHEDELAHMFEPELKIVTKISDDHMYQVTGIL